MVFWVVQRSSVSVSLFILLSVRSKLAGNLVINTSSSLTVA
jgi:hypothetical protein